MHWAKTLESPAFLYDSMLLATAAGEASKAVNEETLYFYRLTDPNPDPNPLKTLKFNHDASLL